MLESDAKLEDTVLPAQKHIEVYKKYGMFGFTLISRDLGGHQIITLSKKNCEILMQLLYESLTEGN